MSGEGSVVGRLLGDPEVWDDSPVELDPDSVGGPVA
jgi:hypothetical protein